MDLYIWVLQGHHLYYAQFHYLIDTLPHTEELLLFGERTLLIPFAIHESECMVVNIPCKLSLSAALSLFPSIWKKCLRLVGYLLKAFTAARESSITDTQMNKFH